MREHIPLHCQRGPLAGGAPQRDQCIERAEQECPRPGCRIEDSEPAQLWCGIGCDAFVHPARSGSRRHREAAGECGFQARVDQLAHQRRGRVVAAACAPLVRIHHAFEHAAEHVGSDEIAGIAFADGEMKALEELVEGVAPIAIDPDCRTMVALERSRLEQPAV